MTGNNHPHRSKRPKWQPIETIPLDTAVLVYGFGYDVAHYNTALKALVACYDHRPISDARLWTALPPPPEAS